MLNIVHILSYTWENGGVSKVVYDLSKSETEKGNKVTIYTQTLPGQKLYKQIEGVEIIEINQNIITRFFPMFSTSLWKSLNATKKDIDVLHIHALWNFSVLAAFLLNLSNKSAITIHGTAHPYTFIGQGLKRWLFTTSFQRNFLKKAKVVHVLHEGEKRDLENYLNTKLNNIVVVPNGIDLPDNTSSHKVENVAKKVLFLSRLHSKKGIDLLLPAFKKVVQEIPSATLLLAGPDFGMLSYIEEFINTENLGNNIKLLGSVHGQEKINLLSSSDVFVLPSYSEGFSIAVLEALSYKLPVVVSSETGLSPEISDANAGIVADLNAKAVSKAILEILRNRNLAETMGQNGYNLVVTHFETKVVCEEFHKKVYALFETPVK